MIRTPSRLPVVIAIGYALAGLTYIVWSDRALEALTSHNHTLYRALQTWKGWGYIVITAILLWTVLRFAFKEVHQKMRDAQFAERRLRLALDAADGLVWTAVAQGDSFSVTVTGTISEDLGLDRQSCMDLGDIRRRIHPDDLDIFDSLHSGDGHPHELKNQVVCRIRSVSGAYRWLKIVPEALTPALSGSPLRTTIGVALDISEQIEMTERLNDAIHGGQLGVWRLNLETNAVEVNDEWARMIGYELEELLPLNLETFHALLHPEDRLTLQEMHKRQIAESRIEFVNELRMRHKKGNWVWVLSRGKATQFSSSLAPSVLSGVHVDISDRKALEKELTSERDFLVQLTATSISGILGLDGNGRIRFANAEAERILGGTLSELQSLPAGATEWEAQTLTGDPLPAADMPFQRVMERGQPVHGMRLTIRRPDGARCAISLNGAPLQSEGSPIRVVLSLTDITDELKGQRALERAAELALHDALHDPLTGLPNREYFSRQIAKSTSEKDDPETLLMLAFLDVDNFKLANDIRGHLVEDELLVQIANRLSEALPPEALLSRIGGDEFTILMRIPEGSSPEETLAPLTHAFSSPFLVEGDQVWLTCSVGVSLNPQDATLPEDMMRHADIAMYQSKSRGRSQVQIFSSKIRHQIHSEADVTQALRQALEQDKFHLAFQSRHLLARGNGMVGAEVLLRSKHPILSQIGPHEFIPVAERNGLIRLVDLHVVGLLGKTFATYRNFLPEFGFKFSLNLSAESLKCDGFGSAVVSRLQDSGLSASIVLIEVTETAKMGFSGVAQDNISEIRKAGYEFSIDDFGTGHSSLSRLHELPLEELKIDRSFVARLGESENPSNTVVLAILALARELGLRTVAEGVEDDEQKKWLSNHGCDAAQGYLFSRPADAQTFFKRLDSHKFPKVLEEKVL